MKTESVGGNDTRTRMVSYLTRLNYDYKNKYYLGGSFRTDGSSRFQRDNVGVLSGQYPVLGVLLRKNSCLQLRIG